MGFKLGSILGAIPVIGDPLQAGYEAIGSPEVGGSGGGGSTKYTAKLGAGDISWIFSNMDAAQRSWLEARFKEANPKDAFPADAAAFHRSYSGGSDGKITSQAGVAFAQNVESLYATMHGNTSTSTTATNPPGPQFPAAKAAATSILDSLKNTLKNILGATLAGAAEGAKSASEGAETGSKAGAIASNTKATLTVLFVLVIVIALVWYVFFKRGGK